MSIKTLFNHVQFNKQFHSYSINGQKLKSVSKLVKSVTPEFDSEYWSKKKAKERGISQAEILAEWDAKGKRTIALGNEVHAYIEKILSGDESDQDNPFLALNQKPIQCQVFDDFWEAATNMMTPIAVEYVVAHQKYNYAGTADALMETAEGEINLWDWKTGSKFNTANKFATLHPPFDDLDDCELNKYSLQISLYRLAIEHALGREIGDSYIVYLAESGYTIHKALDLRERAERWLESMDLPPVIL